MRNVALLVLLLVVAAISYGLGRKHGASADRPIAQTPTITDAASRETVSPPKTSTRTKANPVGEHSNASDTGLPFAQNMSAFARGYEAAKANVDEALSRIATLPVQERMGFITGIFSFVARNHSPADALRIYQRVPEASRPNALRALVGEWIYARSPLDEDMRYIKREGTLGISGFRLGILGLSRLSAWWVALGIDLERGRPGCPQDNGGHERLHLDIGRELEAHRLGEYQSELDEWRQVFNEERPHEALGMRRPTEVYCRSNRVYTGTPADLQYPGMASRRVLGHGRIHWKGQGIFISTALQGWSVGLEPSGADHWNVWFGRLLLGRLEESSASFLRATENQTVEGAPAQ